MVHEDASEDRTIALLEDFARDAPFPVRIERAPARRGHVEGFLRAALLCASDTVAFCDQDDVWLERKLEVCGDALDQSRAVVALHSARVVDAELREIAPRWPDHGPTRVVPPLGFTGVHLDAPGMAMVFRRSLLDLVDPADRPPSRYGEGRQMMHDEWILFLGGVIGSIQLLADPLVQYRQHGENDTGWFERERRVTLEPQMDDYRGSAELARSWARFLSAVTVDDPAMATRFAAGAEHYRRLERRWALRMDLYKSSQRRARARLLGRLVSDRAYGARTEGGFGRRALAKDMVGAMARRTGGTS